ncbi:MAG: hypothetical protein KDJ24_20770 [Gammaproteobacteria bacterium]|nr:hypothetical protein [Gammaproteobacteria bacterium]
MSDFRKDEDGHVYNSADDVGDDLGAMASVEREFHRATVNLILQYFRRGGGFSCVKVRPLGSGKARPGRFVTISGYVTAAKFIDGLTPEQIARVTGVAPCVYANGVEVLVVAEDLKIDQIGPRYTTEWPAGASPLVFDKLHASPHPDYPAVSRDSAIFQCVIFRNNAAKARLVAILSPGQPFRVSGVFPNS